MKARVTVTLKTGILDPQGKAIEGALRSLGVARRRQRAPGQGVRHRARGRRQGQGRGGCSSRPPTSSGQHRDRELPGRTVVGRMKAAVLVFPGINRERDMARTLKLDLRSRAGDGLARRARAARRHRSGGDPRRLLLRRLSALRRDRGARADHGRGARLRRQRRAGARRLQRLPDPVRSRAAAGRADAQREPRFICRDVYLQGRALRHAVHPRLQCRPGDPRAGRAWRGQLHRRRRDHRAAGRRGAGDVPLRRRRTA